MVSQNRASMLVCVHHVYMCVCIYVCMHICVYVRMHICTCMYDIVHVYILVLVFICLRIFCKTPFKKLRMALVILILVRDASWHTISHASWREERLLMLIDCCVACLLPNDAPKPRRSCSSVQLPIIYMEYLVCLVPENSSRRFFSILFHWGSASFKWQYSTVSGRKLLVVLTVIIIIIIIIKIIIEVTTTPSSVADSEIPMHRRLSQILKYYCTVEATYVIDQVRVEIQ